MENQNGFWLPRKERGLLLVFLFVAFLALLIWRLLPHLIEEAPQDIPDQNAAWEKFKAESLSLDDEYVTKSRNENIGSESKVMPAQLFRFDPNTVSEEELFRLGLPLKTAQTFIKYRTKGGKFYKAEDLQKLYTLTDEDYRRIAPFVSIASVKSLESKNAYFSKTTYPEKKVSLEPASIDLNTADAETLMLLKGIGPGYSKRIIDYRNVLGGFFVVDQLQEVYGLPDSTYQRIKDKFVINSKQIHLISLNTASEDILANHPYIRKQMAKNIVLLRNDLKKFTNIEQLRLVPLINEEKYRKIVPYLSLD